jgi:hypothetical protein
MSEFASGLFAPFMVTKTLTTLGATFFTIGAKLFPSFTSRANGLLSTWTCKGAFGVPLPLSPLFKAKPVARESAVPPSKSVPNASGLIDFLVIVFSVLIFHYDPARLANALLEHYNTERKRFFGFSFSATDALSNPKTVPPWTLLVSGPEIASVLFFRVQDTSLEVFHAEAFLGPTTNAKARAGLWVRTRSIRLSLTPRSLSSAGSTVNSHTIPG